MNLIRFTLGTKMLKTLDLAKENFHSAKSLNKYILQKSLRSKSYSYFVQNYNGNFCFEVFEFFVREIELLFGTLVCLKASPQAAVMMS